MMDTEEVSETLAFNATLTWLITRKGGGGAANHSSPSRAEAELHFPFPIHLHGVLLKYRDNFPFLPLL